MQNLFVLCNCASVPRDVEFLSISREKIEFYTGGVWSIHLELEELGPGFNKFIILCALHESEWYLVFVNVWERDNRYKQHTITTRVHIIENKIEQTRIKYLGKYHHNTIVYLMYFTKGIYELSPCLFVQNMHNMA